MTTHIRSDINIFQVNHFYYWSLLLKLIREVSYECHETMTTNRRLVLLLRDNQQSTFALTFTCLNAIQSIDRSTSQILYCTYHISNNDL